MNETAFVHSGFFVIRTPLLPFDELERFGEGLEAVQAIGDPEALETALGADRRRLRERLRAHLDRPEVREALFVGSPNLDSALEVWLNEPDSPRGEKLEGALVRYFERMAGRATPFGLFAGCSVGRIDVQTGLSLAPSDRNRRHSRLDQDYLDALVVALEADSDLRQTLRFWPNSSLYRAAGQLRFAETRLDGRQRAHHLAAVEESEHLEAALERAREGATPSDLAAAVADTGVSTDDAAAYVDELIGSQVLVADLAIPVTGPEPLALLAEELAGHASTEEVAARLVETERELEELDAHGPGVEPARYRRIAERLRELPAELEPGRLFQVDLHKPAPEATLGEAVVRELERAAELLQRLAPPRPSPELQRFRERFAERFEQREVPLVDALDDDVGVGFPEPDPIGAAPLLEGLAFPADVEQEVRWGERERHLLRRLLETIESGLDCLELDSDDIEALAVNDAPPLPDAFAVSAVLAAAGPEALDRGDFRLLVGGVDGPSGGRLLGRFAHGDPELRSRIEEHLRAEEALHPEAIFAEVVHLPEGRIGNIIGRPLLREHEIPYLGRSGAPRERQIPVSDLLVSVIGHPTASPPAESIVLRSRRLGRRVIPRLTSAHNFSRRSVPLYRFLCLLQGQGRGGGGWDWGPLRDAPFLPRVQVSRLVLSRARWRIGKDELRGLSNDLGGERFRATQRLRERRRLPRLVGLQDMDNVLSVDLDNVLSIEALVAVLKGRDEAALVEMWPAPDELCARGPEGRYVHELIVPFVRTRPVTAAAPAAEPQPTAAPPPRRLPPGSDWLYVKLYAGTAAADRMLPELVAPLAKEVVGSGAADSWFFIRYADPHEHLRLRFRGDPAALRERVQPRVEEAFAPLLDDGRAWRLAFDTYEREIERYGGPDAIELAEQVFHADSDTVLELLSMFEPGDPGAKERWRMGLSGVSILMADMGLDEPARIELLRRLRESFGREHRIDADHARKLGERLREHRPGLEALVAPGEDAPPDLLPGIDALRRRSQRIGPLIEELHELEAAGRLTVSRPALASSFVHMYMNRLIRSAPRLHELAVYDFLLRLYESRAARRRTASAWPS